MGEAPSDPWARGAVARRLMPADRFRPYGPDHLAVLALLCVGVLLLVASGRWLRRREVPRLRRVLAVLLLGHGVSSWGLAWLRGVPYVPCQLCDLALVLAASALWSPNPTVSELAYFWGLAGSLQALLTPALEAPFPSRTWCAFFLNHLGIVLTAVYLAASGRIHPTQGSVWRAWGLLNVYAGAAGAVNWLAGTNYGFLAQKPAQPSLLDYFGPWPWYIVAMEAAALGSFYLCYAPYARRVPG